MERNIIHVYFFLFITGLDIFLNQEKPLQRSRLSLNSNKSNYFKLLKQGYFMLFKR